MIRSRENEYLEQLRWLFARWQMPQEAVELVIDDAVADRDWCSDTHCRPAGEFYGPDGQHSPKCLAARERAVEALKVLERLKRLVVSGNEAELAAVEIGERGFPLLTREQIRALAPCGGCGALVGEFCTAKNHLGEHYERVRSHHGRMQAAQKVWFERFGPEANPATNLTTNEKE